MSQYGITVLRFPSSKFQVPKILQMVGKLKRMHKCKLKSATPDLNFPSYLIFNFPISTRIQTARDMDMDLDMELEMEYPVKQNNPSKTFSHSMPWYPR